MSTLTMVIAYVVMGIGLIGMIWCVKNQRKNPNAQPLAVVCMSIVVISTIVVLNPFGCDPEMDRIEANVRQFEKAKVKVLADYVNQTFAGRKGVLLIDSTMKDEKNRMYPIIEDFKKQVTNVDISRVEVLEIPDPNAPQPNAKPGEQPPMPMMPEEYINAKNLNAIFAKCKDMDVIINFVGLPSSAMTSSHDLYKLSIWKSNKLQMVLYNDQGIYETKKMFERGKIAAGVISLPDSKFDFMQDTAPEDLKAAFDVRYYLVTPKNIKAFVKKNPNIFME